MPKNIYVSAEIISYESLTDADYISEGDVVEEAVSHAIQVDKLHQALQRLAPEERKLINALFFSNDGDGISERKYAEITGIPRTTIEYRKRIILAKLKQLLQF